MLTLLSLGCAVPALGEDDIFTRPENCKAIMTVQKRECAVENIYICEVAGERVFRHEDFNASGADGVAVSASNYHMIADADAERHMVFRAHRDKTWVTHPEEIIATGRGESHQVVDFTLFGITKPLTAHGVLTYQSPPLVIDGVTLERLKFDGVANFPPPVPTISARVMMYYDRATGALFDGEIEIDGMGDASIEATAPAEIVLPGEQGFESNVPVFDCNEMSSVAPYSIGDAG